MTEIVLATSNPHKIEEMNAIFAGLFPGGSKVRFISLSDACPGATLTEPAETGTTFEQNATIKAESYAAQTGRLCLADDSGLEIDALGGRPGVISSHYCTDGRETGMSRAERDAANNARVLRELEPVPGDQRSARFVCVMVLASARGAGFQPARFPTFFDGAFSKGKGGDLPHWQVGGATYFVTFRIGEGLLDEAEREVVSSACRYWHGSRMVLHLAVVMPDHVHLMFRPLQQQDGSWPSLSGLMQSIKGFSSRGVHKLRGTSGTLWQPEYFDRIMRTPEEMHETLEYIAENPVRAGLVKEQRDYPFTFSGSGGLKARPPRGVASITLTSARGTFEGRIGRSPRGENGFGYDPLFLVAPDYRTSSAELSPEAKNALSHRGAAARILAANLRELGVIE